MNGETDVADVFLQSFDSVVADDEPELEGAEAAAQRNLPVLQFIFFKNVINI